ncbi:MAG: ABC transporter ATP-binding protein [Lachnospiraceae bacterium]|nr:ABC transporter ATP-binding protein [Lachnospiraceae bacterium]
MIKLEHVVKKIKNKMILDDINFVFHEGRIYGLYGINGSGKTMILRAISGLLLPDGGEIWVDGKMLGKDIDFPESIGLIIENMEMLGQYDAKTNLEIIGKIKKVATVEDIAYILERVGLQQFDGLKVKKYSLGMKQRLNIAQAMFENPDCILLDEPFNALDDEGRRMLADLLLEEKGKGKTIIIAHHYREELEKICDEVLEVNAGAIVCGEGNF